MRLALRLLPLLLVICTHLPLSARASISLEWRRPPTTTTTTPTDDFTSIAEAQDSRTIYEAYFLNDDIQFLQFSGSLFRGLDLDENGELAQSDMDMGLDLAKQRGTLPRDWQIQVSTFDLNEDGLISASEFDSYLRSQFQTITVGQLSQSRKPFRLAPYARKWHDDWFLAECPDGDPHFSWDRIQKCVAGQVSCNLFTCQTAPSAVYDEQSPLRPHTESLFESLGRTIKSWFGWNQTDHTDVRLSADTKQGQQGGTSSVVAIATPMAETSDSASFTEDTITSYETVPAPIPPPEPSPSQSTTTDVQATMTPRSSRNKLVIVWDALMLSFNAVMLAFCILTISTTTSMISLPFVAISFVVWLISLMVDLQKRELYR